MAVCLGLGFSVGCQAGKRNYVNENDKLRSQNLNLTRTVTKLEKSLAMRLAQIDGLEQRLGRIECRLDEEDMWLSAAAGTS